MWLTWAFVFSALHQPNNQHVNNITIILILSANDINVFLSHEDKDCLTKILNAELNKLSIWFRVNRLSLNLKNKTHLLYLNHAKSVQIKQFNFELMAKKLIR